MITETPNAWPGAPASHPTSGAVLERRLDSAHAYVEFLTAQQIPVLRKTRRDLEALASEGESVSGRQLSAIVGADPLMTLKLLTHLQGQRRRSQNHDITTIDRAVMMLGITPFLETFSGMPTLEERLAGHPKALFGALRAIQLARQASTLAREWAVARHDLDVDEIGVAALLYETADILMWTFAPAQALRVANMQRMDPRLRSATAQRAIYGIELTELERLLVRAWKLPELLISMLDEHQRTNPRVRNVELANRFARHVAHGWDDAALPDDLDAIERLIHVRRDVLLTRLGAPDEVIARLGGQSTHR